MTDSARTETLIDLGRRWGGPDWQRPLARALVGAGLLHGAHADKTVRRWASGERAAPEDVIAWLRLDLETAEIWAVGATDRGRRVTLRLAQPRFYLIGEGDGAIVTWIDAKPDPRLHGRLVAEALSYGARQVEQTVMPVFRPGPR